MGKRGSEDYDSILVNNISACVNSGNVLSKASIRGILPNSKTTEGMIESSVTHFVDIGYRFVKRMLEQNPDYKTLNGNVPNFLDNCFSKSYSKYFQDKTEAKIEGKKELNISANMSDLSCNLE